ncbi:MAG: aminotransferase class V-fold PLP-dependent enzyme [Caldilineaceae bacterium]
MRPTGRKPDEIVYFDNAATSWPKPAAVTEAMVDFMQQIGANPGRAAHRRSIASSRVIYEAREAVADLFGADSPLQVVFTANVTEALNLALRGYLRPGDHVVTSSMEHNAVMRPLRALEADGVEVTVVPCSADGVWPAAQVEAAIRPNTTMIAMMHASNVTGSILPVSDIGALARRHGLLLLLDAAQTAGALPIDLQSTAVDLLAFTGHKSLLGPMGTGGLVIGDRVDLARLLPLTRGGTGSRSESEHQPTFLPDRYESGTPNAVGLAGLAAGVRWLAAQGVDNIKKHETGLVRRLATGISRIDGATVYAGPDAACRTATLSFNLVGISSADVGQRLDDEYGILCRVGLHCAPAAHRTIGTFPAGTVRFGLSVFNTVAEVDYAVEALHTLAEES